VAAVCCCGVLTFATYGAFWGQAARQQRAIVAAVRDQYPAIPAGSLLLLAGAFPYAGPAQVFESAWDFPTALTVTSCDPPIRADIVTPRLTVEPSHIGTVIYGAIRKQYP